MRSMFDACKAKRILKKITGELGVIAIIIVLISLIAILFIEPGGHDKVIANIWIAMVVLMTIIIICYNIVSAIANNKVCLFLTEEVNQYLKEKNIESSVKEIKLSSDERRNIYFITLTSPISASSASELGERLDTFVRNLAISLDKFVIIHCDERWIR